MELTKDYQLECIEDYRSDDRDDPDVSSIASKSWVGESVLGVVRTGSYEVISSESKQKLDGKRGYGHCEYIPVNK